MFWRNKKIEQKHLFIDADVLQGICIYIIANLQYPHILTELALIEEFITKAASLSNRAFSLVMLKSSCEYLLEKKEEL